MAMGRPPLPAAPAQTRAASRGLRAFFHAPGRVPALVLLAVLVLVRALDPEVVETIRLRGFDIEQQIAPRLAVPLPVRIVAIDENSLARYGQWPWPRTLVAQLVRRIAVGKPRVLAVDVLFSEPDRFSPARLAETVPGLPASLARELAALPDNEVTLADALRMVPTVLGVGVGAGAAAGRNGPSRVTPVRQSGGDPRPFLPQYSDVLYSLPEVRAAARGQGALAGNPDADGVLRRLPLFVVAGNRLLPTLALETLRVAAGAASLGVATAGSGVQGATIGDVFFPTDRHGRAYPHFAESLAGEYVSAADLLAESIDPAVLRGTFVFLGVTGQGLIELRQTPVGLMRGVEVHVQLLESMLSQGLLRRPSMMNGVEIALLLAAGLLTIFALPYRRPPVASAAVATLVALLVGAGFASFRLRGLLLDGVYPGIATVLTFGVMLAAALRAAEAGHRRLTGEIERERQAQARLDGELAAARAIQKGLLPQNPGDPARHDIEIFTLIEPARTVGGDLYDFFLLDEDRLSFAIADVSGKGVPAALFMSMTKEVLREATVRHGAAVDRTFAEANAKIATASDNMAREGADMMFVTAFAAVLDLRSGVLAYGNAGHDSPFVVRRGTEARQLAPAGGPPLGTLDAFSYPVERYLLAPGDLLLLYTDGVTEAEDANHSFYTKTRLQRLLTAAPAVGAQAVVDLVYEDVRRFAGGAEQSDDIALVAVRWLGKSAG